MARPQHLPDFTDPPLDEVVLGVQFSPIPDYSSVNAQEIWNLFKSNFPLIQEQPLLQPQFETFGGSNLQASFQFQLGAPVGSRLWFISSDSNHLVQFQPDRFLANWRKSPNPHPYPRFEKVAAAFESNLSVLSQHLSKAFEHSLDVNQAEVSYINIIPVEEFSEVGRWLTLWSGGHLNVEALNANFTEVIRGDDGKPMARLHHEIRSVFTADGKQKAYSFNLTFRGKPNGIDVNSAMEFLAAGRIAIVTRFDELTTVRSHEFWGKKS